MSVYPFRLGEVCDTTVNTKEQKSIMGNSAAKYCPELGQVLVDSIFKEDPVLAELERLCEHSGLSFNNRSPGPYAPRDYTFGAGSVGPHVDDGMSLVAAVLVATAPLSRAIEETYFDEGACQLFAGGKILPLQVGDAFVFNGDVEHAWMANCRWVLAVQSVRKQRKRLKP